MRNFIEAVRRKAAVVYVGSVREVHELARNKFDIKARAVVSGFRDRTRSRRQADRGDCRLLEL